MSSSRSGLAERSSAAETSVGAAGAGLPEPRRNRLLRRLDWRFLAGLPHPAVAACFVTGELREAVGLIAGRMVAGDAEREGECDLVVAEDPDDAELERCRAALRPGGVLYFESVGKSGTTPEVLRRRLRRAGFGEIRMLAPQPRFGRGLPVHWLPLEAPRAAAYAMASRPKAEARVARARRGLGEAVWLGVPAARTAMPHAVIAFATPTGADAAGLPGKVPAWLERGSAEPVGVGRSTSVREFSGRALPQGEAGLAAGRWDVSDPSVGLAGDAARFSYVLLTGGRSSLNKVVALVFPRGSGEPALAVKAPRVPESAAGLDREAETLIALGSRRPPVGGVPRVVFREEIDGVPHVGETIVAGTRVERLLASGRVAPLIELATDWQIRLAADAAYWPADELRRRVIEPALGGFEAAFGRVADRAMLRGASDLVRSLSAMPRVCEQRDFSPWNVLVTPAGELAVLDWESSVLEGVPATDLIYFHAYSAVHLRGAFATGRYEEACADLRDPMTPIGAAAVASLARYSEAIGIDAGSLAALRILTWMIHAPSAYAQAAAAAGGAEPEPERLRASEIFRFWEAEVRSAR